jgi:hypothetical protein
MNIRKPRGVNGIVRISSGEPTTTFLPTDLPKDKDAIEQRMFCGALREINRKGLTIWPTSSTSRQNGQNHWDFTFQADLNGHSEHVELAEIAPLDGRSQGFTGAPSSYRVGSMVDSIMKLIQRKADRYGQHRSIVHLLLYVTHFGFRPCDSVIGCLHHELQRRHHGFQSVVFFMEIDQGAGILEQLFPCPEPKNVPSVSEALSLRYHQCFNADPRTFTPVRDDKEMLGVTTHFA